MSSRKPLFAWDAMSDPPKPRPNTYEVEVWHEGKCIDMMFNVPYHTFDELFAQIFFQRMGLEIEIRFRKTPP